MIKLAVMFIITMHLSLGFDLPIWNRNQGNIKISENKIEENKVIKAQKELEVKNEIIESLYPVY